MISLINAFLLLCGVQGVFLSVLIYKNYDKNRHEKYFLILIILLLTINIIAGEIVQFIAEKELDFLIATSSFQLLIGPVFYYFCKNITDKNFKHSFYDIFNILPFIVYLLFLILVHIILELVPILRIVNKILWLFIIMQLGYYLFKIKKMTKNFEQILENDFSSKDKLSLDWLNYIIISIIIVLSLYFIIFILLFHNMDKVISSRIFFIILSFFIYFFGYKGLRQKQVIISNDIQRIKYAKSSLTKEYTDFWKEKLIKYLENKKPYLDPELSLSKLAQNLGLSENNLSQIINSELKITFYDLINNYRIEEVKNLLISDNEFNILDTALSAGFNSKSTFNTIFKRKTGLTPTQFKNSIIQK